MSFSNKIRSSLIHSYTLAYIMYMYHNATAAVSPVEVIDSNSLHVPIFAVIPDTNNVIELLTIEKGRSIKLTCMGDPRHRRWRIAREAWSSSFRWARCLCRCLSRRPGLRPAPPRRWWTPVVLLWACIGLASRSRSDRRPPTPQKSCARLWRREDAIIVFLSKF